MPLVLDTLVYADRQLLRTYPVLARAQVYVHFQSTVRELDTVEYWGVLGDRSTWPKGPTSILLRMIYAVVGWPPTLAALPADLSIDLPSELNDVEAAMRQQQEQEHQRLQQQQRSQQAAAAAGVLGPEAQHHGEETEEGEQEAGQRKREPAVPLAATGTTQTQQAQSRELEGAWSGQERSGASVSGWGGPVDPPGRRQQELLQAAVPAPIARGQAQDANGNSRAGTGVLPGEHGAAPGLSTNGPCLGRGSSSNGDGSSARTAQAAADVVAAAAPLSTQRVHAGSSSHGAGGGDGSREQLAWPPPSPSCAPSQPALAEPAGADPTVMLATDGLRTASLRPSSGTQVTASSPAANGFVAQCSASREEDESSLCSGGPGCTCGDSPAAGSASFPAQVSNGIGAMLGYDAAGGCDTDDTRADEAFVPATAAQRPAPGAPMPGQDRRAASEERRLELAAAAAARFRPARSVAS